MRLAHTRRSFWRGARRASSVAALKREDLYVYEKIEPAVPERAWFGTEAIPEEPLKDQHSLDARKRSVGSRWRKLSQERLKDLRRLQREKKRQEELEAAAAVERRTEEALQDAYTRLDELQAVEKAEKADDALGEVGGDREEQLKLEKEWSNRFHERLEQRLRVKELRTGQPSYMGDTALLRHVERMFERLIILRIASTCQRRPELLRFVNNSYLKHVVRGFDRKSKASFVNSKELDEDTIICSLPPDTAPLVVRQVLALSSAQTLSENKMGLREGKTRVRMLTDDVKEARVDLEIPPGLVEESQGEDAAIPSFDTFAHTHKLFLASCVETYKSLGELGREYFLLALSGRLRIHLGMKKNAAVFEEFLSKQYSGQHADEIMTELCGEEHLKKWDRATARSHSIVAILEPMLINNQNKLLAHSEKGFSIPEDDLPVLEKVLQACLNRAASADAVAVVQQCISQISFSIVQDLMNKRGSLSQIGADANAEDNTLYLRRQRILDEAHTPALLAAGVLLNLLCHVDIDGKHLFVASTLRTTNRGEPSSLGVIKVDPRLHFGTALSTRMFQVEQHPVMVCKPDSWSSVKKREDSDRTYHSPFISMKATLLRPPSSTGWITRWLERTVTPCLAPGRLSNALDFMSQTPWAISETAHDHLTKLRARGESIGEKLKGGFTPLPPKPPTIWTQRSWQAHLVAKESSREDQCRSLSAKYQLDSLEPLVDKYVGKTLYFPVNCDFRGRTYPLHASLNYQSSDYLRSLLEFGEDKPLGKEGLWYLKIHAANLMGLDKKSFNARIKWVDDNVEEIIRSRDNPDSDQALWRQADKPLLGYATLVTLANALCYSGPIEEFPCRLPVHVDGSCNGLQHYSAMARDPRGAVTANLTPRTYDEEPSDVYSTVLTEVVRRNQSNLLDKTYGRMANILADHLKRKTIKQSVMTNVYGVTKRGMTLQIARQLEDQFQKENAWYAPGEIMRMSAYIADLVDLGLKDVFQGAVRVQKWFKDAIFVIREAHRRVGIPMTPICFTNPIGLPVGQPYFAKSNKSSRTVNLGFQSLTIDKRSRDSTANYTKQRSAFAPNFVHSMDAAHVHLTALKLKESGITCFGSVHDSYWAHAADMPKMTRILRESFVELYSENRLDRLHHDLQTTYGKLLRLANVRIPPPPPQGDFDLNQVLHAPYFFA
eukprot:Sspe_Gene.58935::Locus_32366_Transcript_1_1_Confidence_1.000_Length_3711::g.58935::m.58935/K10908/POLRMT, RPO41; DNA-directed RNA polymerase, mitochondrial